MKWLVLLSCVAAPALALAQDVTTDKISDGTARPAVPRANPDRERQEIEPTQDATGPTTKRLKTRLDSRLDTRITVERLTNARDALLGRDGSAPKVAKADPLKPDEPRKRQDEPADDDGAASELFTTDSPML